MDSFTPQPLYPGEITPGTHWIGGWVGPTTGLDNMKLKFLNLPGLKPQPLGRPTRSLSLNLQYIEHNDLCDICNDLLKIFVRKVLRLSL
jgi:hypothetical protein